MRGAAAAALLFAALGCGEPEAPGAPEAATAAPEPTPTTPAGAVLRVEGIEVRRQEVDRLAAAVGELYPAWVQRQRRRAALTNVVLPRAAARARHPEAWARARAEALACAEALAAGAPAPREPELLEGGWSALGLAAWTELRETPEGRWSEPFDELGRFLVVRLLELEELGPRAGQARYRVELLAWPYVPAPGAVQEAVDASRLEVLDPAWGELVPEAWKHRMRGESP